MPCGTLLDYRSPEDRLQSHADLWPLQGAHRPATEALLRPSALTTPPQPPLPATKASSQTLDQVAWGSDPFVRAPQGKQLAAGSKDTERASIPGESPPPGASPLKLHLRWRGGCQG
jgi:hypothetical protein